MAIRIELPPTIWEQICDQAGREWRTPKQQAEYLILRALGWDWPPADSPSAKLEPKKPSAQSAQEGSAS